jgi:hypothetical protein
MKSSILKLHNKELSEVKYKLEFESPEIKRCDECPFYSIAEYDDYLVYKCSAADSYFDDDTDTRMTWCPLKETEPEDSPCYDCERRTCKDCMHLDN